MTNKFHIVYSKNIPEKYEYNEFSTSCLSIKATKTLDRSIITNDEKIITFNLNNKKLTKLFMEIWEKNKSRKMGRTICWNVYKNLNQSYREYLQQQMNETIDKEFSLSGKIDKNLKLTISEDIQFDKLNAIHFYFEAEQRVWTKKQERNMWGATLGTTYNDEEKRKYFILETLNQLVHLLEKENNEDKKTFIVVRNVQFLPTKEFYELQDDDYETFEIEKPGNLYLDYATIGKDLYNCFLTNDIELIKNNEVKPQSKCMPYVNFRFNDIKNYNIDFEKRFKNNFIEWCKKNKIDQYIDYTSPKHYPGRALLGEIVEKMSVEEFDKLLQEYPYIIGAYVE